MGRQLGLTAGGLGLIFSAVPIVGLAFKPLMGGLADKYGPRLVLSGLILSALLHYYSLQWLPPLPAPQYGVRLDCRDSRQAVRLARDPCLVEKMRRLYTNTSTVCRARCQEQGEEEEKEEGEGEEMVLRPGAVELSDSEVVLPGGRCSWRGSRLCSVSCPGQLQLSRLISLSSSSSSSESPSSSPQYWLLLWLLTLANLSFGSGCALQESLCHQLLGEEAAQRYGQHRLWASVGWGLMAAVSGHLVDLASQDSLLYSYHPAFTIMLVCWAADILVVSSLSPPHQTVSTSNPWADVASLLTGYSTLAFLAWCLMVGLVFGSMGLHFWLLEDLAGSNSCREATSLKLLQGLCLTVNCLGETPVFFLSGRLISWLGANTGMVVVLVAHGVRLLYYSLIVTPWQILPAEILQGITFGFFFPCLVSVSAQLAPPGAQTTMTSLAWLVFDCGGSLGGWASARLYQQLGGSRTYWLYGWASLLAALLTIALQAGGRHRQRFYNSKVAVC